MSQNCHMQVVAEAATIEQWTVSGSFDNLLFRLFLLLSKHPEAQENY
jgi:hypothetical protein